MKIILNCQEESDEVGLSIINIINEILKANNQELLKKSENK